MKLVNNKFFAITVINNKQIGEIVQTGSIDGLALKDPNQSNPE